MFSVARELGLRAMSLTILRTTFLHKNIRRAAREGAAAESAIRSAGKLVNSIRFCRCENFAQSGFPLHWLYRAWESSERGMYVCASKGTIGPEHNV